MKNNSELLISAIGTDYVTAVELENNASHVIVEGLVMS